MRTQPTSPYPSALAHVRGRYRGVLLCCLCVLLVGACATARRAGPAGTAAKGFSADQRELITAGAADAPMRVYKITSPTDSTLLREDSEPVRADPNDPLLRRLVDRMYATVRDSMSLGAGIAAPQVGVLKDVIWVQRFDREGFPFEAYLNPRIVQYTTKTQTCREGCLSIPGRRDTLSSRAYAVLVEYDLMDATHRLEMVEDFTAVIFQHEVDHLNGILYLDHLAEERAAAGRGRGATR